jgi:hypothetical protein
MSVIITEYCNVVEKSIQLGLNLPNKITILPRNYYDAKNKEDLLYDSSVETIRKLFRQHNIEESRLESKGEIIPCIQENDFSLVLPTIFVSSLIMSQNTHAISLAISIISNYATDFFKGIPGRNTVRLSIVVETMEGKSSKKVSYEGDCDGLKEIADIAGKVFNNDK